MRVFSILFCLELAELVAPVLPGNARFHSGTSSSSSGKRDIQSGFPPSCSRCLSSMSYYRPVLLQMFSMLFEFLRDLNTVYLPTLPVVVNLHFL